MAAAAALNGHFVDVRRFLTTHHAGLHRAQAGLVAPMDRANVDTDAIIPKQFLKSIHRSASAQPVRRLALSRSAGEPGQDPGVTQAQPRLHAELAALGSARFCWRARTSAGLEPRTRAVGARAYGFRALIAPSLRRHLLQQLLQERRLPIVLLAEQVARLFDEVAGFVGYRIDASICRGK
jgi:3-isopropylmalate/(R)-2-methylmalate dehydratase small subunit